MSALLLDERPVVLQPSLVRELGIAEAAIVQQLHYWVQRATQYHDGHAWVYKTYAEWSDEIGLTAKAVRGALDRLRKQGVVVAIENPGDPRDRTLWWRIDHDLLTLTPGSPSAPTGRPTDPAGSSRAGDQGRTESTDRERAENAPASEKKIALPDGFPDELRPHLKAAYRVLRDLAVRNAAKEVNPVALAHVLMANHHKQIVYQAHECASHYEGKAPKDVVACYRNWMRRADTLAVVEPLDDQGRSSQPAQGQNGNVHPLRSPDKVAAREARYADRQAATARAYGGQPT